MQLKIFKKGFNYSQDGPGNRLVYHLQGCNMRCIWCSNPEGIAVAGTLLVNSAQLLDGVCPHGAIVRRQIDRARCADCAGHECLTRNRNQAMRFSAQSCDLDALVDEAKRSAALFYDGGGVTLSGGEVTLQFKAARTLLQRLREAGIHTAIETNGTHPRLDELFPLVDYLIIDFKHHDDRQLRAATGVGNLRVKRNLAKAIALHPQLLVRIPLIAGVNDSPADAEAFAAFFRPFDTRRARFEFLAYHDYGRDKWAQSGMSYRIGNGFVKEETLALFDGVFRASKLDVIRT
jgi:glycyl-radical enzyme activating protein